MHYSSVQVEVFLAEYVLFVIAIGLYSTCLGLQLTVSLITQVESVLDFTVLLHPWASKGLIFEFFAPQSSDLLDLDSLDIWDDLLVLPHDADGLSYILFDVYRCTKKLRIGYYRSFKVRQVVAVLCGGLLAWCHRVILLEVGCLDSKLQSVEAFPVNEGYLVLWTPLYD